MFTVKFFMLDDEGAEHQTSISCSNYSVHNNNKGLVTITTYPTMTDENGVERHVAAVGLEHPVKKLNYFNICFIENEKGKTIQHIKQPK